MPHLHLRWITLLFTAALLSGCASLESPLKPTPSEKPQNDPWWQLTFSLATEDAAEPRWWLGPLLGREVIYPAISREKLSIPLWRVHRRASDDVSGHQFSILFVASSADSDYIVREVVSSPITKLLKDRGLLLKIRRRQLSSDSPSISDTSDPKWPEEIQQSWPYLAHGASLFWISLVEQCRSPLGEAKDYKDFFSKYHQTNTCVETHWKREAQHAVFHHLSGIFGYHPFELKRDFVF